jgi:hypothetical protein
MEVTVDKLIGTCDLSEASSYLCAVKEGRVMANRVNYETIPMDAKRVSVADLVNYRAGKLAEQRRLQRSEKQSNVLFTAALTKIKWSDHKSLRSKRMRPKKPGRLEKIRAEYNREYFSRPPRREEVVPQAQEVVQGELGSGVSESGDTFAEEDSEVNLCEEIPSTSTKLRLRKQTVKFKEVQPKATRKRRSPEEREERAHEMSVGRVRVTPPPAHVLLRYIEVHEGGRVNPKYMAKAASGFNPTWRNSGLFKGQINRCSKMYKCPICVLAKRGLLAPARNARDPNDFSRETSQLNSKNASPGSIISMDPSGLVSPSTAKRGLYSFCSRC